MMRNRRHVEDRSGGAEAIRFGGNGGQEGGLDNGMGGNAGMCFMRFASRGIGRRLESVF